MALGRLGVGFGRVGSGGGAGNGPFGPSRIAIDFVNNVASVDGANVTLSTLFTVVRATAKNAPNAAGLYTSFSSGVMARTNVGCSIEPGRTQNVLRVPDLTNAAWTVSGSGADLSVVKNLTDLLGNANSACTVTVATDGGTLSQSVSDAANVARWPWIAAELISSSNVIPGTIELSIDGGSTYTNVTPNGGLEFKDGTTQTLANPSVILRFSKAGDVWGIYYVGVEKTSSTNRTSPIFTAGVVTVRNADDIRLTDVSPVSMSQITLIEWTELAGPISAARTIYSQRVDANNIIDVQVLATNKVQCRVRATSDQCNLLSDNDVIAGATYRVAFRHDTNDCYAAFSAALANSPKSDSSVTLPAGTIVVGYGQNGAGASQMTGYLRQILCKTIGVMSNSQMRAWAQSAADVAISFSNGDTFSPPSGVAWPTTVNGFSVPQSVTWSGSSSKFQITGNPLLTSYVDAGIATATPYYADAAAANDSGNGLTPATAKQKISSAIGLANADGQSAGRIIVAAGTYYQDKSINGLTSVEPTKPMGLVASGGYVAHVCSTEWSFPGSPDPVLTNCYVGGPATALRAFDRLTLDSNGLPTEIPLLADAATVNATASGGFYNSGGVTTFRRADASRPTLANTLITGDFDTARFHNATTDIYVSGFEFEGGKNGALVFDKVGATRNIVATDGYARYSGGAADLWDAFIIQGTSGFALVNDFDFSKGMKDGLNLNAGTGITVYVMALNPTGWSNGKSPAANCNWMTGHTTVTFWGAGPPVSNGGDSLGPDVHFIDTTKSYIVGVWSKATSRGGVDPTSFKFSTSALAWLEKVTAESVNKSFSAVGGADPAKATILLRGTRTVSGVQSAASGGIIGSF